MTISNQTADSTIDEGADDELLARFRPIFDRIAAGASERERGHRLPFEEIRELAAAGFGAVRVPVAHGGAGATLPQLFRLLTELAAADSNIPQALRGHFALVEDRLVARTGERDGWLDRFGRGEIAGNSWTEVGSVQVGDVITKVTPQADGTFRITGQSLLLDRQHLRRLDRHLR